MIGRRFGKLVVLRETGFDAQRNRLFVCVCDCGKETTTRGSHLRSGHTTSCGCSNAIGAPKHGEARNSGTVEYAIWRGILKRCRNPKARGFKNYGGRGVSVCARWEHGADGKTGFECFLADVGRRPSPQHSVDRYPNASGNYEPGNVRWATGVEQRANRRS